MMDWLQFLDRLDNVQGTDPNRTARCPAHDDKHNSLSVGLRADRILLHCHAGCQTETVLARMGLGWADVMPHREREDKGEIVATYDYTDEKGQFLYQVVRYYPKAFRQRRRSGAEWTWDLKGVRRGVPYRLPELLKVPKDRIVYIVEGEKDANLMWSLGYPATTNSGGAEKWTDQHAEFFEGRKVVILPDNDKAGAVHLAKVEASLRRYRAAEIHVINLPDLPDKGDVSDWWHLPKSTTKEFEAMIEEEIRIAAHREDDVRDRYEEDLSEAREKKWWNLSDITQTTAIRDPEGFLHGEMFCRGRISMIYGKAGSGKSYLVMFLGSQIGLGRDVHNMKTRPGRVLFLSEEMGGPDLRFRVRQCFDPETVTALSPDRMGLKWHTGFDFYGGKQSSLKNNASVQEFIKICRETNNPDVVFIDSLSRIHHAKENDNSEMGAVMANLETAARLANVALVFVHHQGKDSDLGEKEGGRGASTIKDYCQDVLKVQCISKPDKKSVVHFEKTQSLAGGKEAHPFIFTQETDPSGRTVTKSDGSVVSGVLFTTANYDDVREAVKQTTANKDIETVVGIVENLIANQDETVTPDGEIERKDLISKISAGLRWNQQKVDRAIKRAADIGKLLKNRLDRGTVMLSLPPKQN
jgi:RecA-family ATPase